MCEAITALSSFNLANMHIRVINMNARATKTSKTDTSPKQQQQQQQQNNETTYFHEIDIKVNNYFNRIINVSSTHSRDRIA